MDNENNESVYNRFGKLTKGEGMTRRVVEGMKCSTLRWFGHSERIVESELTKREYISMIDAVGARGWPPVRWEDRVLEYLRERGERSVRGLEHARRECKDRNKWLLFCRGHPLGEVPRNRHQI